MAKVNFKFEADARLCKACGICMQLCPVKHILRAPDGKPMSNPAAACIGCKTCEYHCPDFAIRIGRD